ncbi:5'-methylthioadenosine/adenosylhomocysteine nucleosidase [Planctobacterium marinum]|uniref:5'-methylthioadenosine/adenosylhomocysteine nucleosidase n=1 Tax=Planctobacterium marinum TaxID=1631968 RepID=UPI001E392F86|nr:5'-methylthioadenosine/adenosylhomocysteine nucleosidase [Planctobacterium marinum]MCC2605047.1 5'-methylthioadenosine/adenosylhomocysteine nucleosidase [Planctobacterium marinum]
MKIGILGAMDQEIALLKQRMQLKETFHFAHLEYYVGTINDVEVVLVKCGIGKVAASVSTTVMIDRFAPDFVVNTGSAGGFDTQLNIGDVVIATGVQHHDVDVTHFGYKRGQVYGMPDIYPCDVRMVDAAVNAANNITHTTIKRGLVCTGDSFIGCDEAVTRLRGLFPDMSAVEMEGAAIGQTCFMLDTPFLVIRSLSDIAGKESSVSFSEYLEQAGKNSAELVMAMIQELAKYQD